MILIATPLPDLPAIAAVAVAHGWPHRAVTLDAPVPARWDIAIGAADDRTLPDRLRMAESQAMLAIGTAEWIVRHGATLSGYDQVIDRARLSTDLPAAVADWSHADRMATIDRLAAAFGDAAIARLLTGLRGLLEQALAGADTRHGDEAHRIAGLAGTLGFAALGRAWARVAEDDGRIHPATRRATAHALATLARTGRI